MKRVFVVVLFVLLLTACGGGQAESASGFGMGDSGMMARHHAQIPAEFAGKTSPVAADAASLKRGEEVYVTYCASCHGDGGMGDGPAASSLNPAPAPIAHSSQMMADDYLYWRITKGGAEFGSAMPGWEVLTDKERWDVINYMRALGSGSVAPGSGMGGATYDPQVQAARQAELLAEAVKKGVVTQDEADTFALVHDAIEQYRLDHPEVVNSGTDANAREAAILAALVEAGTITQVQADAFGGIHDRLGEAGLMP